MTIYSSWILNQETFIRTNNYSYEVRIKPPLLNKSRNLFNRIIRPFGVNFLKDVTLLVTGSKCWKRTDQFSSNEKWLKLLIDSSLKTYFRICDHTTWTCYVTLFSMFQFSVNTDHCSIATKNELLRKNENECYLDLFILYPFDNILLRKLQLEIRKILSL